MAANDPFDIADSPHSITGLHRSHNEQLLEPSDANQPSSTRDLTPEDRISALRSYFPLAYVANNYRATDENATTTIEAVDADDFYRTYDDQGVSMASIAQATQRHNRSLKPASRSVDDAKASDAKSRPAPEGGAAYGKPSVKDLTKRFDQSNTRTQTSNTGANITTTRSRTAPRIPTRQTSASASSTPSSYRGTGASPSTNDQNSYSTFRSSVTRNIPPGSVPSSSSSSSAARPRQRDRCLPEDLVSVNAQSFASRVNKPRAPIRTRGLASKSMSNLSPPLPNAPPLSKASDNSPAKKPLLFGEILPESDAQVPGHGIDNIARRTSESNLRSPSSLHQRTQSHADAEPQSPNGATTDKAKPSRPTVKVPGHNRAHSDLAGTKSSPVRSKTPLTTRRQPIPDVTPSSSSKLLVRKHQASSSSSTAGSPPDSRTSSPSTQKRPSSRTQGKSKTPLANSITRGMSASRARGTSAVRGTSDARPNSSAARARTPTSNPIGKRPAAPITANGNTRLNAYISTTPAKLSPPLRSSRPRQPVSSATTASSRMRAAERGRSPAKLDPKTGPKPSETGTRRRKISMGPIDFESRREQIKLSYTKSIRETEAKAAARRQAAAERERKKREAEAKAREAELAAIQRQQEQDDLEKQRLLQKQQEELEEQERRFVYQELHQERVQQENDRAKENDEQTDGPVDAALDQPLTRDEAAEAEDFVFDHPPLVINTTLSNPTGPNVVVDDAATNADSPTLGIPGSFPNLGSPGVPVVEDAVPQSAISNTTEFDIEPQTEPPQQHVLLPAAATDAANKDDTDEAVLPRTFSEYKSPFEDESTNDDGLSIKISLDASPMGVVVGLTQTRSDVSVEPDIPGSFKDEEDPQSSASYEEHEPVTLPAKSYQDDEYVPKPFVSPSHQTTVTIIRRESDFSPTSQNVNLVPGAFVSPSFPPEGEGEVDQDGQATTDHSFAHRVDVQVSNDDGVKGDDLERLEDFYVGPKMADSAALLRDSTNGAESRISGPPDSRAWSMDDAPEPPRFSTDTRKTGDTRPSLNVPRTSLSANRTSQNTAWTDFSISSRDEYSDFPPKLPSDDLAYHESGSISEAASRSQSIQYDRDSRLRSSAESSPHDSYRSPMLGLGKRHQLPELDTGDGFVVDYIIRKNSTASTSFSSVPALPDHSPPPPPDEAIFPDMTSSVPPSEYYDDTRPNSYFHGDQSSVSMSRPQSEAFDQPDSTMHKIDQRASEKSEGRPRLDSQQTLAESVTQDETSGLSSKERKRLFTRLETIKELIDTEGYFIRDMNIVEEIYKGTAEACPKLDDKTIKLIFRNTDQIIAFHSTFFTELKEGVSSVYVPRSSRTVPKETSTLSDGTVSTVSSTATGQLSDAKDRETSLGPIFSRNMEQMKIAHETFLKNSDHAAKRLIQIQEDPTVKVWLNECNEVARDLTKAWNLDSLLIKPMQRITKYPNLLIQLLHETPQDHPDRPALESAKASLEDAIEEINKTKKNFELVGQIVGRKRKESDVRAGFARAFGKRVDKLQATNNRPTEDAEYLKLHEKFGDDYLRLQVVLRDVEFYTRQVTNYVHEFLQYLSSMELVMRLQPSPHPELESKWVRFNVSMRDIEKVALEQHLSQVRKHVIEPFEMVIKAYGNPSLAMKKRSKRRLDYEKSVQLKKSGKKLDKQLSECVEHYEALNEALKKELPKLSALTEKVGNICLGNLVNIQTKWFSIWKEKVKVVLGDSQIPELSDIISIFQRDYKCQEEDIQQIAIANPGSKVRSSQSTSIDDTIPVIPRINARPSDLSTLSTRVRGLSVNSDVAPSLPTPDFIKRHSGQFTVSPTAASNPSPQHYYKDYYAGINGTRAFGTPTTPDLSAGNRSMATTIPTRPGTGQSYESNGASRQSVESSAQTGRFSNSNYPSPSYQTPENHRFSGLFHSALPLPDGPERAMRPSRASSRASSRERQPINGYNVLWLAASLFEFNIETTKHEAGYPYLTYQAGEIFDVIAEKGELWLAKNQDDPNNLVGWLWSKHFAKLADD